jgi:hypothetical protein
MSLMQNGLNLQSRRIVEALDALKASTAKRLCSVWGGAWVIKFVEKWLKFGVYDIPPKLLSTDGIE